MANRRMKRELELLSRGAAAPGISAWPREDGERLDMLDAEIRGSADTPYEGGVFQLEVQIPREYPLKPPRVRFVTRIYHPNIDAQGRICLDSLNMPPKGAWKPSLNVATVLSTIQCLMGAPNGDDGLMADITEQFRRQPALFRRTAAEWTRRYASGEAVKEGAEEAEEAEGVDEAVAMKEDCVEMEKQGGGRARERERDSDDDVEEVVEEDEEDEEEEIRPTRLNKRLKKRARRQ